MENVYSDTKVDVAFLPACHELQVSEIFAPVILRNDTKSPASNQGSGESEKQLRFYKEIFFKEGVLEKNIILFGKPGVGKTTFCKHLTDIWCNSKVSPQFKDTEELKKFRQLFSVSCRFAGASESIFDMICNQLLCKNDEMIGVARQVLKNTPEECLVVVDGIDEWKGSAREATGRRGDIPGIPSRKGLEDCVVLFTSRPERILILPTKLDKTCSVLELQGIDNYEKVIHCILDKAAYPDPEKSCSEFLSQIEQSNMADLLQVPLMLINALNIWDMNKTLSSSMCINYSNMVEGLFSRAKSANLIKEYEQERRNETYLELPDCFRRTDLCKQNAGLIVNLGKLAYDLLFNDSQDSSLIFSGQKIKLYLTEVELSTSLATGILSKAQIRSRSIREIESFSFYNKTFQEFLGALWLSMEQSNLMIKFTKQFESIDDLFANQVFIQAMCGLSPDAGERFWQCIANEVIEKNELINNDRLQHFSDYDDYEYTETYETQHLVLKCIKEARCSSSEHNQQLFYVLPDICIDPETSKQDIYLIYGLMKKNVNDIKSVKIRSRYDLEIFKLMPKLQSVIGVKLSHCTYSGSPKMSSDSEDMSMLQLPHQLKSLTMEDTEISQIKVEYPLQLTHLFVYSTRLSHSGMEQLCSSLRDSSTLQDLELESLYCSDHGRSCCLPALDLQRHHSLEIVRLENLSVESVLLPGRGTLLSKLTKLTVRVNNISHLGMEQLYSSLRDSSTLKDLDLERLYCSDHGASCCLPALDLQRLLSLRIVRLENLSVESVLLPGRGTLLSQLIKLTVRGSNISHRGMEQLYSCLRDSSTLQDLELKRLYCSDHGRSCCLPALDLQRHHWLETVTLENLSVESVLLPRRGTLLPQLKNLTVRGSDISQSSIEQLYSCLRSYSTLQTLELSKLSSSDHGDSCCHPALDLHRLHSLQTVRLEYLSVESVLLPRRGTPRSKLKTLTVRDSNISHRGIEKLYLCLNDSPTLQDIELESLYCSNHGRNCRLPALDL